MELANFVSCMRPSTKGVSVGTRQLRQPHEAIDKRGLVGTRQLRQLHEAIDKRRLGWSSPTPSEPRDMPPEHDRHRGAAHGGLTNEAAQNAPGLQKHGRKQDGLQEDLPVGQGRAAVIETAA